MLDPQEVANSLQEPFIYLTIDKDGEASIFASKPHKSLEIGEWSPDDEDTENVDSLLVKLKTNKDWTECLWIKQTKAKKPIDQINWDKVYKNVNVDELWDSYSKTRDSVLHAKKG